MCLKIIRIAVCFAATETEFHIMISSPNDFLFSMQRQNLPKNRKMISTEVFNLDDVKWGVRIENSKILQIRYGNVPLRLFFKHKLKEGHNSHSTSYFPFPLHWFGDKILWMAIKHYKLIIRLYYCWCFATPCVVFKLHKVFEGWNLVLLRISSF